MAGDKRSGGWDGALTNLTRRGRGDKVGRDLKPSYCHHHRHGSAYPLDLLTPCLLTRVVSHLFTGGLAGIGKLPALVGWYIRYGITAYTNFLPL
jgi:hypothetical protein